MPPPIGRRRIREFQQAFGGELTSLAALYRNASAEMLAVLGDASANLLSRQRAVAHLRQYQTVLAELGDEAALWIETNIPRAYHIGVEFADHGIGNIRKAGINLQRREREVFAQVHREAVSAIAGEMLRTTDYALAQLGRRADDVFRRVGIEEAARGIVEGKTRVDVTREIRERLLAEGRPMFVDRSGRAWDLDRYSELVARTTTREAMTQGTINRLREHGVSLAQVSAHNAPDFCLYYEHAVVNIGEEPHPVYPPISAIGGGPPFHPNCVHVLTPFVERLATPEELERGKLDPEVLGKSPAELQRRFRHEHRGRAGQARAHFAAQRQEQGKRPATPERPPWEAPLRTEPLSATEITDGSRQSMDLIRATGGRGELTAMNETAARLAERLAGNPDWQAFVERHPELRLTGHGGSRSEAIIANLIDTWSGTSGGDSLMVAMQRAAVEEFGMKQVTLPWPQAAVREAVAQYGDAVTTKGLRACLRGMYDETQQWFRERGIQSVLLFRGMQTEEPIKGVWFGERLRPQKGRIELQPLSSFSGSMGEAYGFAERRGETPYRVLLAAEVPVERVISTGRTGMGTLFEHEYVLLGDGGETGALTWLRGQGTMTKPMEQHLADAQRAKGG